MGILDFLGHNSIASNEAMRHWKELEKENIVLINSDLPLSAGLS